MQTGHVGDNRSTRRGMPESWLKITLSWSTLWRSRNVAAAVGPSAVAGPARTTPNKRTADKRAHRRQITAVTVILAAVANETVMAVIALEAIVFSMVADRANIRRWDVRQIIGQYPARPIVAQITGNHVSLTTAHPADLDVGAAGALIV